VAVVSDHERVVQQWQTIAFRLVGMGAQVEDALNLAVACALGRDALAIKTIYADVAPTLNADRKIGILRSTPDPHGAPYLDAATTVMRVRNALAHSSIVKDQVSLASATFTGAFRGRHTTIILWDVEAWLLERGHNRLVQELWRLSLRLGDSTAVGRALGFLDD
jgi:hypothetical protein